MYARSFQDLRKQATNRTPTTNGGGQPQLCSSTVHKARQWFEEEDPARACPVIRGTYHALTHHPALFLLPVPPDLPELRTTADSSFARLCNVCFLTSRPGQAGEVTPVDVSLMSASHACRPGSRQTDRHLTSHCLYTRCCRRPHRGPTFLFHYGAHFITHTRASRVNTTGSAFFVYVCPEKDSDFCCISK